MPTRPLRRPVTGSEPRWPIACRQWQGARPYQEDDFDTLEGDVLGDGGPPGVLMVLADGMGGEAAGEVASRTVVEAFMNGFGNSAGNACARFQTCLEAATDSLREQAEADPELDGMGSTVVAAHYDGRELSWLSVGDSPMWLFTGGNLLRLNADHSMAPVLDRLARDGELSPGEARCDSRRNMLRSAVTAAEAALVDCAKRSCRLHPHDCLLIASDGIQTLAEEDIERQVAAANGDVEAVADALSSAVRHAAGPGQDNVTFLLLSGGAGFDEGIGQWSGQAGRGPRAGVPPAEDRVHGRSLRRGLGLGLALGLLAGALAMWWLEKPSPDSSARTATSGATRPAGDGPEARRLEPGQPDGPARTEAPAEEAPAPHGPATSDPDTREPPRADSRSHEAAAGGEALSKPDALAQPAPGTSP